MTPFPVTPHRSLLSLLRSGVGSLLLLLAVAAAVLMVVPAVLGMQRYVILTGSMTGTYDPGSLVYDREVPTSSLRVGDVITYAPPAGASPHALVTHRIVSIGSTQEGKRLFRTKGDANRVADPWRFTLDRPTQAKVSFGVPYAGYAVQRISDRHTRLYLIALPAVLIALWSVVSLFRDGARDERGREGAGTSGTPAAA
jgi:signal peptidase I